jgi:CubicO group peptidase (beta-lactamase class C family)
MDAVHRLRAIQLHLARPAAKTASDETIAPAPGHELFSDDTVYTPWAPGGSVGGKVAAGWEPVKAAFAENFAKGLEKGAQLVIRIAGETVVDLHGASPSNQSLNGQPFGPDTMTNIYSSGKQIETVVMAILVDRGLVSYDDKVAQHWPAFAQGDKGNITIADVMRHEGGCPYFLAPSVTSGTAGEKQEDFVLVDTAGITGSGDGSLDKAIEQSPRVEAAGGNTRVYHAMTRGCLVDGVLRRVDPAGRSIAQFVREEITEPLGVSSTYRTEIVDPAEQQSVEISPVVRKRSF